MPLLRHLGRLIGMRSCPVAHDEPEPTGFLAGMMNVCARLVAPEHRDIVDDVVRAWFDKHPESLRNAMSEALPGGRYGPPIKGSKFYGDHVVDLDGVRIDLEKLMLEVLKLNDTGIWSAMFERLHRAEGGAAWPPTAGELKNPNTTVATMLRGYADESGHDLDNPESVEGWAAMTIQASNSKFFANALGYAVLNALFGKDLEAFVARGADGFGPSGILLSAIAEGELSQTPAKDVSELVSRLHQRFSTPERTRDRDTVWGLLDAESGFGHCPAKKLSRLMMTSFADRLAADPDGFIGRVRDNGPPAKKTVYQPRAEPTGDAVRSGPLARHQLQG